MTRAVLLGFWAAAALAISACGGEERPDAPSPAPTLPVTQVTTVAPSISDVQVRAAPAKLTARMAADARRQPQFPQGVVSQQGLQGPGGRRAILCLRLRDAAGGEQTSFAYRVAGDGRVRPLYLPGPGNPDADDTLVALVNACRALRPTP